MNVHFTSHAQDRMIERGVSEEEVFLVLQDPELDLPGQAQSRKLYRHVGGRHLKVYVQREPDRLVVITVAVVD